MKEPAETRRILVVDDEEEYRVLATTFLERSGYTCASASDADEALRKLDERPFHLVVSDIRMKGKDGLRLMAEARGTHPHLDFIIMTGYTEDYTYSDIIKAGATDFIHKPFDMHQLLAKLQRIEREKSTLARLQEAYETLSWEAEVNRSFAELSRALISARPFEDISSLVLEHAKALTGSPLGYVSHVDRETGHLTVSTMAAGTWELCRAEDKDAAFRDFHGLGARVLENGKSLRINDFQRDLPSGRLPAGHIPIHRFLSAVATVEDRMVGQVSLANSSRDYSEKDLVVIERLADVFAVAVQRRQMEDSLRKSHGETEQLLASIPSLLIELSEEDRVVRWNPAARRVLGKSLEEVFGLPLEEVWMPVDWKRVRAGIAAARSTGKSQRLDDVRFLRSDGKEGFLSLSISCVQDHSAGKTGLILLGSDVTERKILEGQLAQAQKLESIGQLAAGIAHEINTPTQYVGDNVRFLQDAFKDLERLLDKYEELRASVRDGPPTPAVISAVEEAVEQTDLDYLKTEIPKAIEQSLEGIRRVSKIVRAMREFSHPGLNEKTALDINRAIESTLTVTRNEWKYVAEVVTDFDPNLPLVPVLPGEFNQVILNMIINAAHAIGAVVGDGSGAKGTITLRTRKRDDSVEISIGDTGTGIPEEIRSKIFDPFFTTKEVGKGTGQGLAISHSVIVEKHGGKISFESQVGKGTTFFICLPTQQDLQSERRHEKEHSFCG